MNHTEAVVAKRVREYESLCRLVQETQRLYQSAKEAEGSPKVSHDEYMRRAFEYHRREAGAEATGRAGDHRGRRRTPQLPRPERKGDQVKTITVNGRKLVPYESTNLNTGTVSVHVVDYHTGLTIETQVVRQLPGFDRVPEGVNDVLARVYREIKS
jgi:hypothetical protein